MNNLFIIILWAIGLVMLLISLFIEFENVHSITMLLWAYPSGVSTGTAISELTRGR